YARPCALHVQDFFFLVGERLVDLLDRFVGQRLHIFVKLAVLILVYLAVLLALLQGLEAVAAHVASGDPRLLGIFVRDLGELLSPLLAQWRNRHPDHLALALGIESEPSLTDRGVHRLGHAAIPNLDDEEPRLRCAHGPELVERHVGPVGVHAHAFQQARRRAPGPEATQLLPEGFDGAVHPRPQAGAQFVLASGAPPVMMVKRPRPATTSAKPPLSWIEKTKIGMRFSRASAIAAASITCKSRDNTSK